MSAHDGHDGLGAHDGHDGLRAHDGHDGPRADDGHDGPDRSKYIETRIAANVLSIGCSFFFKFRNCCSENNIYIFNSIEFCYSETCFVTRY